MRVGSAWGAFAVMDWKVAYGLDAIRLGAPRGAGGSSRTDVSGWRSAAPRLWRSAARFTDRDPPRCAGDAIFNESAFVLITNCRRRILNKFGKLIYPK